MAFTVATDAVLETYTPSCDAKLELRTNFGSSNTWQEYSYSSLSISFEDGQPRAMQASLINAALDFSDEADQSNRTQLRAQARVTVSVGSESEIKYFGIVRVLPIADRSFAIEGSDPTNDLQYKRCQVTLVPTSVEIVDETTLRPISAISPKFPQTFGFAFTGGGDEAFGETAESIAVSGGDQGAKEFEVAGDETANFPAASVFWVYGSTGNNGYYTVVSSSFGGGATTIVVTRAIPSGTFDGDILVNGRRRAWARTQIQVWRTNSQDPEEELAQTLFRVDYTNGSLTILDEDPQAVYYISGVSAFKESAASGATNVDVARCFEQLLEWPAQDGGMGVLSADIEIVDTGIDIDRDYFYEGRVSDFVADFEKEFQSNIKLVFDPSDITGGSQTGKWRLQIVEQVVGGGTKSMIHPKSIDQSRDDSDMFTALEIRGQVSMPVNQVLVDNEAGRIDDISTAGDWFKWNGRDVPADDTFANLKQYVSDGDGSTGINLHNIGNTADIGGSSTHGNYKDKYVGWYRMFMGDRAAVGILQRLRAYTPGNRNARAAEGGIFWPRLWLQGSLTDATGLVDAEWFTISKHLRGQYQPSTEIDVKKGDIDLPRFRYYRMLGGAFKHGDENQSDPSVGTGELQLFFNEEYKITCAISPVFEIVAASTGSDYFEIDGDYRSEFPVGSSFTVIESTGNNGDYIVTGVALATGNTRISVAAVADATGDGRLYSTEPYQYSDGTEVRRHYPDLWDRFGGWKMDFEDLGDQYNETLAFDYALAVFEERLRLFQSVEYTSVCDPRHDLYDTVIVNDDMNGNVGSMLILGGSYDFPGGKATYRGKNFLAGVLP